MNISISTYSAQFYSEVFKVTDWKNGAVFRTQSIGKYIHNSACFMLPKGYINKPIPANKLRGLDVVLPIVTLDELH